MSQAVVAFHLKDPDLSKAQRRRLESRCEALAEDFPEIHHLEVSVTAQDGGHQASAHATGKATDVATHATTDRPGSAVERALHKLSSQLRRHHDKRIFTRRRSGRNHRHALPPVEADSDEITEIEN